MTNQRVSIMTDKHWRFQLRLLLGGKDWQEINDAFVEKYGLRAWPSAHFFHLTRSDSYSHYAHAHRWKTPR
jgi:hypothetical protein